MELLQLRYFCDAAETEKFSQTAKKFLVPVSNISQSIKRLEKELGTELFNHKGNKITLNSDGQQFYNYVSKALELLDNGKMFLSDKDQNFNGNIRIVCEADSKIVTAAIEKFSRKHPNVNFIGYQNSDSLPDFDILISDTFPCEHSEKIVLNHEDIYVAMNKNHALANKSNVSIEDLKNERFITMTASSSMKNIMIKACEKAGFFPEFAIQTHSPGYLHTYIEMGLGLSFVPAHWSEKYPCDLVFKKIKNLSRKTYAFLPKKAYTRRCVEAFFEALKTEAEAMRQ